MDGLRINYTTCWSNIDTFNKHSYHYERDVVVFDATNKNGILFHIRNFCKIKFVWGKNNTIEVEWKENNELFSRLVQDKRENDVVELIIKKDSKLISLLKGPLVQAYLRILNLVEIIRIKVNRNDRKMSETWNCKF